MPLTRSAPTVTTMLHDGTARLRAAAIERPGFEASLLACHVLGLDKASLLTRSDQTVQPDQYGHYLDLVARREKHEPLAYLTGYREFFGRPFAVDRRVLVPRPETELLVESALDLLRDESSDPVILDVGTGSGCIATTLALELPDSRVVASDVSVAALEVASRNVADHGVAGRVQMVQGDLLSWFRGQATLVAANLPYVPQEALSRLSPDVREFEPHLALDGGPRGSQLVLSLLQQIGRLQVKSLLAEIDARHADKVLESARSVFPSAQTDVLPDLAGRPRLLRVRRST